VTADNSPDRRPPLITPSSGIRWRESLPRWATAPGLRAVAILGPPVVVMVVGFAVLTGHRALRETRDAVGHSRETLLQAGRVLQDLTDAETGQRGFLFTGQDAYLDSYEQGTSALARDTALLKELVSDDPVMAALADTLSSIAAERVAVLSRIAALRRNHDEGAALAVFQQGDGKRLMDSARAIASRLELRQRELLAAGNIAEADAARRMLFIIIAGALLAAAVAALVNFLIARLISKIATDASVLAEQHQVLRDQAEELEVTNQHLHEQATELEAQQAELEMSNQQLIEQQEELEDANQKLHDQAAELEAQTEELHATAERLEEEMAAREAHERRATTDRERLLVATEAARAEAEAANRAKSQFLATMSHELRTPLNAIAGYVQLIELGLHGGVSGEQRESLERIRRNQQHLLSVIDEVLTFARVETGKAEYRFGAVGLKDTFDDVVAVASPLATTRGVTLEVHPLPEAVLVHADRDKLRQVLLNLAGNAIKFTPSGGSVRVTTNVTERAVQVSVSDTGPGIASEHHERIFEPFVQVGRSLNTPQEGTGLGLAISREYARGMGGDVVVTSSPGRGATFTVTLRRFEAASEGDEDNTDLRLESRDEAGDFLGQVN
jgi:signal transduction histidine kinase